MQWIEVCKEEALAEGEFVIVENDDGDEVLVARAEGELRAVVNACSHDGRGFEGGCIEAGLLICPRHGSRFCLRSGKVLTPPAYSDIETFEVKAEAGLILVQA
ncbi:Rieske (2Fe-2S) protein [Marinospirillum insulare]|uniref:Diguanylate cyclase n=1 Tax=Marinospirillum insulare TaxID=217169 RepID=A0ABQ5ZXM9_9GAMM|nr:Rieske (2Fe-2S) protein [Marinospirillum insulare]GLR63406.1 diguanylate cyclase [Marinospirillum insulare]